MHIDDALEHVNHMRASIWDDFDDLTDEIMESECDDDDQALLAFDAAYGEAMERIEKLTRQNAILLKAVEHYADDETWHDRNFYRPEGIGKRVAEKALNEVSDGH